MELWIRSQNREVFVKVKELYVVGGVECDGLEDGYDIENADFRFGRYKTKERALEVLSDIQHKLISLSDSMNRQLYVYEMPKE